MVLSKKETKNTHRGFPNLKWHFQIVMQQSKDSLYSVINDREKQRVLEPKAVNASHLTETINWSLK